MTSLHTSGQHPILSTRGLGLDYGSFTAVGKIDLVLQPKGLHTLIGPNGAGKTSLFNIISGRIPASRGSVEFAGIDVTRAPSRRRAHLGMARSFQITSLFPESSVRENLQLAAMGMRPGRSLAFWKLWSSESGSFARVDEVMDELDIRRYADLPVGQLAHGVQRIVEIGMCLVANPRLLLLDEPLAGLGLADVPRVAELLSALKQKYAVLLVEHNMRVVMNVSDLITVMFQGNVLAQGVPEAIRADPEVRRCYLGSTA
jgi:branched-chain amino acid transport system ATP-binding protein